MTREQYIVKNCPAFTPQAYEHCCSLDGNYKCEGCTDCVIKQVIEECKWETSIDVNDRGDLAERILSSFDIEEINK